MNKDSKTDIEKHGKSLDSMNRLLESMAKNAPKESCYKAIKKRYFKPKTNWAMLGVLVAFAGLLVMVIIHLVWENLSKNMSIDTWLLIGIFILGAGSLIGFFRTKTKGFGRFTTSTFLIILVVVIASLLFAADKLEGQVMANVLFAVFGFAGGLFTSKNSE